jgi:hypothetical protein
VCSSDLDNNPINANGTSNFDLPAHDAIDQAAKEHDICYDNNGIIGAKGVFGAKGLHCDHDLSATCLRELNLKDMAEFINTASMNTSYYTKIVAGIVNYSAVNSHSTLGAYYDEVFKERSQRDKAILIMILFSSTSAKKAIVNNIPAMIDFTAGALKTGLGFATTATTGFFAVAGVKALAVPILSVAAINLLQTEAKCIYAFLKDNAPAHCYSTKGIITHAWDVKAGKEIIIGTLSMGMGKGITENAKILNANTMTRAGKTIYDGGQITTTAASLGSLFISEGQNNK